MLYGQEIKGVPDIIDGLKIDEPSVFIPWELSVEMLSTNMYEYQLSRVSNNYYTLRGARLFNALICNIGLHFNNVLKKIEFFRDDYSDLHKSFHDFQRVFENVFGKPIMKERVSDSFNSYEWVVGNKVKIRHYVIDRFGLTEYLYIECN